MGVYLHIHMTHHGTLAVSSALQGDSVLSACEWECWAVFSAPNRPTPSCKHS